ncbi:MAG: NfeD family protein [Phycisphaerales bacterium]
MIDSIHNIPSWIRIPLLALMVLVSSISLAQSDASAPPKSAPISVPASRQADRIAVITIRGAIDSITAMSVRRRIAEAEAGGYDAIVFEIDSPGGGVGAVLDITNTIKSSSITNTIAWVNPDAYSGGAIIALACHEMVSSTPASMGDAFPVIMTTVGQGNNARGGLRGLTPDERTKLLPPLLADVTDSARRNGYDEYLVQAIVIDGIELWLIEDTETLQRYAINEREYRTLFGEDAPRGMPMIAQVTGGRPTGVTDSETEADTDTADDELIDDESADSTNEESTDEPAEESADASAPTETPDPIQQEHTPDTTSFRPASDTLDDVVREFNAEERIGELSLESHTSRPTFTSADRERYTPIGYITDGSAPIVMREQQLIDLGFSSGIIQTDEELIAFMGAEKLDRANESWSEKLVRFMTSLPVRGLLIAVFLIALVVEMITPGTGIGGGIALLALVGMIAPPAMIGLAGWWEIIAIVVGLVFLLIEAFVIPGFGIFGAIGLVSLFAGLLWSFIPAGSSLSNPATQQDLLGAVVTVSLGVFTAGIVIWLITRNLERIPIFDKLVLSAVSGVTESDSPTVFSAMVRDTDVLHAGDTGIATTTLRPSGQADINGSLVDVVAEFGYIDAGTQVRVTRVEAFRIVVDRHDQENA